MTTRDIQAHLAEVYGAEVSPALISNVTGVVAEEITAWQTRPLDQVYPIIYIDALVVKVRDAGTVDNKAAHLAIGVDLDGYKHVLGIWLAAAEGARFWGGVLTELRNRGVKDVLFVCCDGLGGLPEAIEATWPKAIVQTCVVHYPETVVMPAPVLPALVGGGDRAAGIGIITGPGGMPVAGRVAGTGPAVRLAVWSGRGLAA
jgi:putative transposase